MLTADFQAAHAVLGRDVFRAPLSHDARSLLGKILEHINNRGMRPGGKNAILSDFAAQYTACLYDDTVLGWSYRDIGKKIDAAFKRAKTPDQMLDIARLVPLFNREWDINISQHAQFRFARSVSQTDVYDFITQKFLIDDFSHSDLIKLSEIAKKPLDTIKEICRKLDRPEQRAITYLYRVVNHEEKQSEVITQNTERIMQNSDDRLKDILMAHSNAERFRIKRDASWVEDVKVTRIMENTDEIDEINN